MLLRIASLLAVFSLSGCDEAKVLLYMGETVTAVSGRITDKNGAPISGATVTLSEGDREPFSREESTTTANDGRYRVTINHGAGPPSDLPLTLTASKDGFVLYREELARGASLDDRDIELTAQ